MDSSYEIRREEFRNYLKETGTNERLVGILMKLYQHENRPENALEFVFRELCDENYPRLDEIDAMKAQLKELLSEKSKRELQKIAEEDENQGKSDEENLKILSEKFARFQLDETGNSLLKKFLTSEIFEELKELKTDFDASFLDNIQSGLTVYDQEIGVFASDESSYEIFESLFDPILNELHNQQQNTDEEGEEKSKVKIEIEELKDVDPDKIIVKSISMTINRSLSEFPFLSIASSEQMTEISNEIKEILESMDDEELKGNFHDYQEIEEEQKKNWIEDGILFKESDDAALKSAGSLRLFPHGRGIFLNDSKNLKVWVNHLEHISVTSFENSGDFKSIHERLTKFMSNFENVEFAQNEKFGFLAHNLKLIGNGMTVTIDVKIPQLLKDENKEKFEVFIDEEFLGTEDLGKGLMRLTTKQRLGISEIELISKLQSTLCEIIAAEKCCYVD